MFKQGAFQVDPSLGPDAIRKKRERLNNLVRYGEARSVPRGVVDLVGGFLSNKKGKALDAAEAEGRKGAEDLFAELIGGQPSYSPGPMGVAGIPPVETAALDPDQEVADDAMAALSATRPDMEPPESDFMTVARNNIFPGESGGDYDALFGFSQRPGGKFEGVKPTEMTVGELIQFQDPSGPYGQWVKGQVGRVATPAGAYQGVGTTIRAAVEAGVLDPNEKFSKEAQDRFGEWVYNTQGSSAWEGWGGSGSGQQAAQPQNDASRLYEALSNPWLTQPQRAVVMSMLQQQQQANDPMRQLDMQLKQAQIAKMGRESATAPKRDMKQDQNDVWRYTDTKEPVFPDVESQGSDMTESERRIFMFNSIQKQTGPAVNLIEEKGFNPASIKEKLADGLLAGNFFKTSEGQMYEAAAASWSESALRLATGAAATPEEYSRIRGMYFAKAGDSPETIQFKRAMRESYQHVLEQTLNGPGGETPPNPLIYAVEQYYKSDVDAPDPMSDEEADAVMEEILRGDL